MRKLVLKMSMTVDGFVAGPNGENDWVMRSRDEGGASAVAEMLQQASLHIMGSRSFFMQAAYWPTASNVFAAPMNEIPKVVFTRQQALDLSAVKAAAAAPDAAPGTASWAAAQVASGDLADEIRRLKAQDGSYILAHGGADFARNLVRSGLVDEFRLVIHPVVLGKGIALFSELEQPLDLKLVTTSLSRSGVVTNIYRP